MVIFEKKDKLVQLDSSFPKFKKDVLKLESDISEFFIENDLMSTDKAMLLRKLSVLKLKIDELEILFRKSVNDFRERLDEALYEKNQDYANDNLT